MIFYTDGGCSGNPGPGGYGVVVVNYFNRDIKDLISEQTLQTTNNREEMKAILRCFEEIYNKYLSKTDDFFFETHQIFSDSAYAINLITQWMQTWYDNDWKRSKNQEIENLDLVKQLYDYYITKNLKSQVEFFKVRGHCGNTLNELADALATGNEKKQTLMIKKYQIELTEELEDWNNYER